MVLSTRERYILIATLLAAGVLVLSYVVAKYRDARAGVVNDQEIQRKQLNLAKDLIARRGQIDPQWRQMFQVGMKSDPTEAESQVLWAVHDWSEQAGVQVTPQKLERSTEKTRLPEIKFEIIGTGTMRGLVELLWRIQTATIPIKVTELNLDFNKKEGVDDLRFTLSLTTVYASKRVSSATGGGPGAMGGSR